MNINALVENFSNSIAPKIKGKQTMRDIKKLQRKTCAYTSEMKRNLGGRNHRHLRLTMTLAEHSSTTIGQVFNIPANPGLIPVVLVGATQCFLLATQLKERKLCNLVERTLKNMITTLIKDNQYALNEVERQLRATECYHYKVS